MSENVWNYINPCFKMLNHPTNMYITVLYPQLEVINWFEMTCFIQAQICFHTHKCLNTQLPMSWFRVVHQYLGVNSAQLALTVFTPLPGISYSHLLEGVNLNIGLWGVKLPAVNITGQVWLNQLNAWPLFWGYCFMGAEITESYTHNAMCPFLKGNFFTEIWPKIKIS